MVTADASHFVTPVYTGVQGTRNSSPRCTPGSREREANADKPNCLNLYRSNRLHGPAASDRATNGGTTHDPRPTKWNKFMEALRLIAETTNHQVTIDLPPGMDAKRVEIIVLPADNELPATPTGARRKASQLLRGTVVLQDDLITPPTPEEDWDALK